MTALDKVFELADHVGELMTSTLCGRDLTPALAGALLAMHEQGEPVVQRRLSELLRCTPRYVTAVVDALEARGMVERRRHPDDRRATLVALTADGVDEAERFVAEREQAAATLFAATSPADLAAFVAVADHVLAHLR